MKKKLIIKKESEISFSRLFSNHPNDSSTSHRSSKAYRRIMDNHIDVCSIS